MMDDYRKPPARDCGCDKHPDPKHHPHCPPCDPPPVCELDCLIRPEFHCGQELTEDDLNALVHWTDRRLARSRFRDGWGVACGLDVCIDPRCPTRVKITPGYGVNCCGDDLVLCEPACLDLRDRCGDPCLPHDYDPDAVEKQEREFAARIAKSMGISRLPFRLQRCKPVDICLELDDCPVTSVPHPGSDCGCGRGSGCTCGCGPYTGDDPCAVTRRKEAVKVVLCKPRDMPDPSVRFRADWDRTVRIQDEFLEKLKTLEKDPQAIVDFLARLKFCNLGVVERIFEAAAEGGVDALKKLADSGGLFVLLFWYIIDQRLRLRDRACHDCEDDKLCIARAWLFTGLDRNGKPMCFVGWLDTADPVRRRLGPDRLPVPAGSVNLVELALGRDPQDAALALSAAGIEVSDVVDMDTGFASDIVGQVLRAPPFAKWTERVRLVTAVTCHGPRVIGWHVAAKAVVGTPVSTDTPSRPSTGEKRRIDPVKELDRIGDARAAILRENGIATVGQLIDADPERLLEIVKGWSNLGRNMTPESFTRWLIAHANDYVKGEA